MVTFSHGMEYAFTSPTLPRQLYEDMTKKNMINPITTILAKERACLPSMHTSNSPQTFITTYDVPIAPRSPIKTGGLVEIFKLTPCDYLFPRQVEANPSSHHYSTKEAAMRGMVVGIRAVEKSNIEFIVRNLDSTANNTFAYLAIRYAQGETILLSPAERIVCSIVAWMSTPTRDVPAEDDAVVHRNEYVVCPESGRGRWRAARTFGEGGGVLPGRGDRMGEYGRY
ncbi:hypothetical protein FKP32DRAFT_1682304 [Trametes sanguinea]|nr:hypothetical protein FKP32DRAFT_1682304 [Trametes sanguinea]